MSWSTPKTNWKKKDYINIDDFNRIKNNLVYLFDEINLLLGTLNSSFSVNTIANKTYSDYIYADEMNAINTCSIYLAVMLGLDMSVIDNEILMRNFTINGSFPNYNFLNILESLTQILFDVYTNAKNYRRKFTWNFETIEGRINGVD